MAVLKCKMCGGELNVQDGMTVAECEYCGSKQTLPKLFSDNIANLYDRANHFRRNNDYDKAEGIYERILAETPDDAEAYWSLVLCRYGIEYVEDPTSGKRVPTVNRAQYTSIFDDENYKSAIEHADAVQRRVYEDEAAAINEIQKGILAISQKEEPFDVFICYKESDNNGRRTPDSVLATDLYHQLTNEGFKVFFSRITLEDKLGTAYEPYIFAALNSAKVMVVLGTKPEYFNAVWVKNEWSRYLALVKQSGGKKVLIPAYRDMDPYDLPEEFSHLQAQDMSKLGFMQDLIRGIKKITKADVSKTQPQAQTAVASTASNDIAPLLKRMFMYLEDDEWDKANEYSERVLDKDPENAEAYLGKLMVDLKVRRREKLKNQAQPFDGNKNYNKAIRFADAALKNELTGYISFINDRNTETKRKKEEERRRREEEERRQEEDRKEALYIDSINKMNEASTAEDYQVVAAQFDRISGYKDSDELCKKCQKELELLRKHADYSDALNQMNKASTEAEYKQAAKLFRAIFDYKDADSLAKECTDKAEAARKDLIYSEATAEMQKDSLEGYHIAKGKLNSIKGWKDSDDQVARCETRISEITKDIEAAAKKKKKRIITISSIVAAIIAIVVAFVIVLNTVIIPHSKYNTAIELTDSGKYDEAIVVFKALNGYKDSEGQIEKIETILNDKKYEEALELYKAEKYDEALTAFKELDGYKDSADQIKEIETVINDNKYDAALKLYNAEKYDEAKAAFESLNGYKNSSTLVNDCQKKKDRKEAIDKLKTAVVSNDRETIMEYGEKIENLSGKEIENLFSGERWYFAIDGTSTKNKQPFDYNEDGTLDEHYTALERTSTWKVENNTLVTTSTSPSHSYYRSENTYTGYYSVKKISDDVCLLWNQSSETYNIMTKNE